MTNSPTAISAPGATFSPVYNTPPSYASPEQIERYCNDVRSAGIRNARVRLRKGHRALAFLAMVEATELELSTVGFGSVRIPATDGFNRLARGARR